MYQLKEADRLIHIYIYICPCVRYILYICKQIDSTRMIHVYFILTSLFFDGDMRRCMRTTWLGQWRLAVEEEASRWTYPHEVELVFLPCVYNHTTDGTAVKYIIHQMIQIEGNLSIYRRHISSRSLCHGKW